MSVGAGGDALVQHRLLQRRHLLRERWSVCVRPVQMVNNEWTRIHMADSCMLGERGREEEEQFSHLFSLIDQSLVQLAALVPPTSNSLCSRLFFFNYFCYSSSAAPSLCIISFISPPSFFFSPPTPPARCCFFHVSSSPPSWQRTVREAGTPTCTRRLSGDAAVFSSSNYETNGTLHRITSWRNGAG